MVETPRVSTIAGLTPGARGLTSHAITGVQLMFVGTLLARGAAFFSTIVLARYLKPEDFGLVNMALLGYLLVVVITDTAIPQAFIQSRADPEIAASTTLILLLCTGALLYGGIAVLAPFVASFFGQPSLPPLVEFLAVAYMLHACGRVPVAVLERRLDYRRRAIPEIVGPICQAMVSITLAVLSHGELGVWALAWGYMAQWVVWCLSAWLLTSWRPSCHFDWHLAVDLLAFARDIVIVGLLTLLVRNVDNISIGKLLGAEQLGLYSMAYNISQVPTSIFAVALARVFFPAFSHLQSQPAELARFYRHALKLAAIVAWPIAALTVLATPDFVPTILGQRWQPAVLPLQVLALYGVGWVLMAVNGNLLGATGRRHLLYPSVVGMILLVAPLLYVALQAGIVAVAAVFSTAMVAGAVISEIFVARALDASVWHHLALISRPALAAALSAALVALAFHRVGGLLSPPVQVAAALTFLLGYAAALLAIDRDAFAALRKARSVRATRDPNAVLETVS